MRSFTWKVAVDGYEWRDERLSATTLTPAGPPILIPVSLRFRTYEPLRDHTALFREFASTPSTLQGIQAFANKYGSLGNDLNQLPIHLRHDERTGLAELQKNWIKA